jgi:hypothetical protein
LIETKIKRRNMRALVLANRVTKRDYLEGEVVRHLKLRE